MKKLIAWCKHNVFGVITLLVLVFIPLYPKLPLLDIKNTWVYVRVEDFVVLAALLVSTVLLFKKKVTLRTPLTLPIFAYWIIGAVATIHGIMLIFPTVANVFPNVAFLSFLRRIEYMSLFFVAYWSVKTKQFVIPVSIVLVGTLFLTSIYGLGQKYLGFPAFLTMNEEFAKGIPIQLSALSRVPSTFAGHYDFAAYLVLTIPIALSLMFVVQSRRLKSVLLGVIALSFLVMFTTVSRISLLALFFGIGVVLFTYHRKLVLFSIPVLAVLGLVLVRATPLFNRYTSTVREVQVLVDATNGKPVGHVKIVPNTYFQDKVVKQQFLKSAIEAKSILTSSALFVIPYEHIPNDVPLLTQSSVLTGEDLPQGTGYINLSLSPVVKRLNQYFYEPERTSPGDPQEVQVINGPYLIKKTLAYDLSFTTRFQGEWPNALAAFKKNILIGSGYGSVSLAVDNSYLRMLGEVGMLGFAAFFSLFVLVGLYARHVWASVDSKIVKGFIVGVSGGLIGLGVNALFIDVFEASKIAFVLWMLIGVVMGTLDLYRKGRINLANALMDIATSNVAIILYLFLLTFMLYGKLTGTYFVGDDFTWLRWVEGNSLSLPTIADYFTNAAGFFYRPGAKLYYLLMYKAFWLNQNMYHYVSVLLHFGVATLTFLVACRVWKTKFLAAITAILFLFMTGPAEAVFWISATGFLFATIFALAAVLAYTGGNIPLAIAFSLFAPLFHELGIVVPILLFVYTLTQTASRKFNFLILIPIPLYLLARYAAQSHWFSGDYNYNLVKFPVNAIGNTLGYTLMALGGPDLGGVAVSLRDVMRTNLGGAALLLFVAAAFVFFGGKALLKSLQVEDRRILWFGVLFTITSLLPFLGLGNIASRYGYLASIGIAFLIVLFGKLLYGYLLGSGRQIAKNVMTLFGLIFVLLQVVQLTKLHDNWNEAGAKVERFVVSIDAAFEDNWTSDTMEFHFVNVPIKNGDAWVFPVGIPDVLWFQFHNPSIRVFSHATLTDAFGAVAYGSPTQRVFVFDENGRVAEVKKPRELP